MLNFVRLNPLKQMVSVKYYRVITLRVHLVGVKLGR